MDKLSIDVTNDILSKSDATVTFEVLGNTITVRNSITAQEMGNIISKTIDSCLDEDGAVSDSMVKVIFDALVLDTFTNIELPDSPDDMVKMMYATGDFKMLLEFVMEKPQPMLMLEAVKSELNRRHALMSSEVASAVRQFTELLSVFSSSINSAFDQIDTSSLEALSEFVKTGNAEEKIVTAMLEKTEKNNGTRKRSNRTSTKTSKR